MAGNGAWKGPPVLVMFYSGGFTRDEGNKTLDTLRATLKKRGVKDQLVLDHSNEYGFTGEGYEPWPRYVEKLVELIDKDYAGRSLIIFGHSKGTGPAMSVASRLGSRVLKCYAVACGSWLPGRPTPWEKLSKGFKQKNDQGLLAWFASLNPGNLLLETVAYGPEDQFEELMESSAFLKSKLELMRLQYRDAMYPDMSKRVIDEFPAELCAVSPLFDGGSQPLDMIGFRKFSKSFELWEIFAGHSDVLSNDDFLRKLGDDILEFSGDEPKPRPVKNFEVMERWLTPVQDAPMARQGLPTVTLKSAPQMKPGELKEIYAILNKNNKTEKPLEIAGLTDLPADAAMDKTGTTYTVKVDVDGASQVVASGKAKKGKENAVAEKQLVTVDIDRGPLVKQLDGSTKVLLDVPSFVHTSDRGPAYAPAKPTWKTMQATDQKVMLIIVAKMNKAMDARIQAANARGRTPDGYLPDFLQGFSPKDKEDMDHFWKHYEVKEVE
eukprot:CAMPEP_0204563644 /NCGR_PEP_ID=MMETSP0661-20131031/34424_1 /ASSEMBLY_ACC=CAM_ASM_000606 /TAXON_ID=109239 /ORGANISM="Alexandrium margalefi, Strain AMGDE01CS-322" /LENGTH=492 /DNA_ID=CAMNT_0051571219 /DNA_START=44 /DNA_END=1522 /DNA_ORIENTATION=+